MRIRNVLVVLNKEQLFNALYDGEPAIAIKKEFLLLAALPIRLLRKSNATFMSKYNGNNSLTSKECKNLSKF